MAELLTETNRMHEHAKKISLDRRQMLLFQWSAQHNYIIGKTF